MIKEREESMSYMDIDWEGLKGKTVLDIGTAYGIWAGKASEHGADVTATDVTRRYYADFQKTAPGVKWIQQSAEDIEGEYDVIFLLAVTHHLTDPHIVLDKVFKCAKECVYLEVAINKDLSNPFWAKRSHRWAPTESELIEGIEQRGWKVTKKTYGNRYGADRIFLKCQK